MSSYYQNAFSYQLYLFGLYNYGNQILTLSQLLLVNISYTTEIGKQKIDIFLLNTFNNIILQQLASNIHDM